MSKDISSSKMSAVDNDAVLAQAAVIQLQLNDADVVAEAEPEDEATLTMFPMPSGPQRAAGDKTSSTAAATTTTCSASTAGKDKPRNKVVLAPGHSHMDWVRLKSSGKDLRGGIKQPGRYTLSEIRKHNKADDCWIALRNRVYDITAYLDYHPGGRPKLMSVAGKDATRLFGNPCCS